MAQAVSGVAEQYARLSARLVKCGLFYLDLESEFPWILETEIVRSRTHERLRELGKEREPEAIDLTYTVRQIIRATASRTTAIPEEALAAIGVQPRTPELGPRYARAAQARLGREWADGKHWAEKHRREVEQQLTSELFATFEYGEEVASR